jgi:chemotaxis receptor (MCP) glutamine deamidase CheD
MTPAMHEPNQETQESRYTNQGQYMKGALIKKGSRKQHLNFKAGQQESLYTELLEIGKNSISNSGSHHIHFQVPWI